MISELLAAFYYFFLLWLAFGLPGYAILVCHPSIRRKPLNIQIVILSPAVGMALVPIFMYWSHRLGWNSGPWYAWLPPVLALIALLVMATRHEDNLHNISRAVRHFLQHALEHWVKLFCFFLVLAGLLASRYMAIRSIPAPMWGDSYQHTLIVQLLIDHNGLFSSWQPYADLASFTYHFGFHGTAAIFHWLTGLPAHTAVLITGQALNILAVLMVFPLATQIYNNYWAGLIAVVIAGFISNTPMVYTNWGRYTQLAGLILFAGAVWLNFKIFRGQRAWRKWIIPGALIVSGLSLTHYRVLIFWMIFWIAINLAQVGKHSFRKLVGINSIMLLGVSITFLPWLAQAADGNMWRLFTSQLSTPAAQVSEVARAANQLGPLSAYMPVLAWILALVGCLLAFYFHSRKSLVWMVGSGLILLSANPYLLGLPGAGTLNNFAVMISAFLPVSVLTGANFAHLLDSIKNGAIVHLPALYMRWSTAARIMAPILFAFLVIWLIPVRIKDINPEIYSLISPPDLQAMEWIKQNTHPDARFLVNAFSAYGGFTWVGADAGWWLPYFAQRQTILPPLNYGFETGSSPESQLALHNTYSELMDRSTTTEHFSRLMTDNQLDFVYIGQKGSGVGYNVSTLLDPQRLLLNPNLRQVYQQDKVWIFQHVPINK